MSERIKEKEIKELDTSNVDIITNDEHGLNTKSISIEVPKIQLNTSEIKLKIKSELKTTAATAIMPPCGCLTITSIITVIYRLKIGRGTH